MRILIPVFALVLAAVSSASDTAPAAIKIIANPNVRTATISRDDLNRIFLMTKGSLEGTGHIEPVLEKNSHANELFLRDYIGRSEAALATYYRSLVFTGKGTIPKTFGSDAAVIAYVARTKGAIGYVSAEAATPGVKILEVK